MTCFIFAAFACKQKRMESVQRAVPCSFVLVTAVWLLLVLKGLLCGPGREKVTAACTELRNKEVDNWYAESDVPLRQLK
jgi:hypothetical protein